MKEESMTQEMEVEKTQDELTFEKDQIKTAEEMSIDDNRQAEKEETDFINNDISETASQTMLDDSDSKKKDIHSYKKDGKVVDLMGQNYEDITDEHLKSLYELVDDHENGRLKYTPDVEVQEEYEKKYQKAFERPTVAQNIMQSTSDITLGVAHGMITAIDNTTALFSTFSDFKIPKVEDIVINGLEKSTSEMSDYIKNHIFSDQKTGSAKLGEFVGDVISSMCVGGLVLKGVGKVGTVSALVKKAKDSEGIVSKAVNFFKTPTQDAIGSFFTRKIHNDIINATEIEIDPKEGSMAEGAVNYMNSEVGEDSDKAFNRLKESSKQFIFDSALQGAFMSGMKAIKHLREAKKVTKKIEEVKSKEVFKNVKDIIEYKERLANYASKKGWSDANRTFKAEVKLYEKQVNKVFAGKNDVKSKKLKEEMLRLDLHAHKTSDIDQTIDILDGLSNKKTINELIQNKSLKGRKEIIQALEERGIDINQYNKFEKVRQEIKKSGIKEKYLDVKYRMPKYTQAGKRWGSTEVTLEKAIQNALDNNKDPMVMIKALENTNKNKIGEKRLKEIESILASIKKNETSLLDRKNNLKTIREALVSSKKNPDLKVETQLEKAIKKYETSNEPLNSIQDSRDYLRIVKSMVENPMTNREKSLFNDKLTKAVHSKMKTEIDLFKENYKPNLLAVVEGDKQDVKAVANRIEHFMEYSLKVKTNPTMTNFNIAGKSKLGSEFKIVNAVEGLLKNRKVNDARALLETALTAINVDGSEEAMKKTMELLNKSTGEIFAEKIKNFYVSNLLSRASTHFRNIISNSINSVFHVSTIYNAALLEKARKITSDISRVYKSFKPINEIALTNIKKTGEVAGKIKPEMLISENGVTFGEANASLQAFFSHFADGLGYAVNKITKNKYAIELAERFKNNLPKTLENKLTSLVPVEALEVFKRKLANSKIGKLFNITDKYGQVVGEALQKSDAFAKASVNKMYKNQGAEFIASKFNIKGKKEVFYNIVSESMAKVPEEEIIEKYATKFKDKDLLKEIVNMAKENSSFLNKQANKIGREVTYQERLDKYSQAIFDSMDKADKAMKLPIFGMLAPFRSVMINMPKNVAKALPTGLLFESERKIMTSGSIREKQLLMGKMMSGMELLTGGALLYKSGKIVVNEPHEKTAVKRQKSSLGIKEVSYITDDGYAVELGGMTHLTHTFSMLAKLDSLLETYPDMMNEISQGRGSAFRLIAHTTLGLAQMMGDVNWADNSVSMLHALVEGDAKALDNLINNTSKGLSPQFIPDIFKPEFRQQQKNLTDALLNGLGARSHEDAVRDIFGRPIPNDSRVLGSIVPITYKNFKEDEKVLTKLTGAGIYLGRPTGRIQGYRLSRKEYLEYMRYMEGANIYDEFANFLEGFSQRDLLEPANVHLVKSKYSKLVRGVLEDYVGQNSLVRDKISEVQLEKNRTNNLTSSEEAVSEYY